MSQAVAEKPIVTREAIAPEPAPAESTWAAWLAQGWTLDPRSLAIFRIGVAAILLYDLNLRSPDLVTMYGADSVIPIAMIQETVSFPWNWAPFLISDAWGWQLAMFLIFACCAVLLGVGWQTRWMTIACWIFIASLQDRVPTVQSSGDVLVRMLLFWSMFMPLGQVWSVDAWLSGRKRPDLTPICSAASFAFVGQLCLIYVVAGVYKLSGLWFEGRALDYALRLDQYGSPLGAWFLQFPLLLKFLSWSTLALELGGPLLLFVPWGNAWWRIGMVLSFVGLHIGIHYCMFVGLFSEICIAGWLALLPALAWSFWPLSRTSLWSLPEDARAAEEPPASDAQLSPATQWALAATVGLVFAYVFILNVDSLRDTKFYSGNETVPISWNWIMPRECRKTAAYLALGQKWAMFSMKGEYALWWAARGRLADGSEIDLMREGRPFKIEKPSYAGEGYASHRWDKHFRMISAPMCARYRQPTVEFMARRWNASHPPEQQITSLDLIACYEQVDIEPGAVSGDFDSAIRAHWPLTPNKKRDRFTELLEADAASGK